MHRTDTVRVKQPGVRETAFRVRWREGAVWPGLFVEALADARAAYVIATVRHGSSREALNTPVGLPRVKLRCGSADME